MITHIIINHCLNPECARDYYAQRCCSGSLKVCAERLKGICEEFADYGYNVTDAHDDPVDPDTIVEKVLNGELACIQMDTGAHDIYTIVEI
jgi:hypothetical protein